MTWWLRILFWGEDADGTVLLQFNKYKFLLICGPFYSSDNGWAIVTVLCQNWNSFVACLTSFPRVQCTRTDTFAYCFGLMVRVCESVPCKVCQVARQTPFEIVMNTCQTHIIRAINRCELKTMNRPKKTQKTKTTRRQHSEMNKKIANSYLFFMIDQ